MDQSFAILYILKTIADYQDRVHSHILIKVFENHHLKAFVSKDTIHQTQHLTQ